MDGLIDFSDDGPYVSLVDGAVVIEGRWLSIEVGKLDWISLGELEEDADGVSDGLFEIWSVGLAEELVDGEEVGSSDSVGCN